MGEGKNVQRKWQLLPRFSLGGSWSTTSGVPVVSGIVESITSSNRIRARIMASMASFRAKRLDLGCFINNKIIRDHTKRKVFEDYEPERYAIDTPLLEPRASLS